MTTGPDNPPPHIKSVDAPKLTIDFVLQRHFSLLSFTAAADALTTANLLSDHPRFEFRTTAVQQRDVLSDLGIVIEADRVISPQSNKVNPSNIVLVCGGYRCDLSANAMLTSWLQSIDDSIVLLGGLWNGVAALAHAGLMDGFTCALHPHDQDLLQSQHPDMQVLSQPWVMDRNRLSAAGPNSTFELMLSLIRRHDSIDTAQAIRQLLKADTSVGTRHISPVAEDTASSHSIQRAMQLMRSHIDTPLSKKELARQTNMSIRALERLFQRQLEISPARCYLQLRLQRAHELLSQSELSINEVSDACGFVSCAHFSRTFSRHYGLSPTSVRRSVKPLLEA